MTKRYDLPVKSPNPSFSFQTDLDSVTYTFSFCWNERIGAWFMAIADAEENPLVSGVRVTVGYPLAFRSNIPALFPGMLMAVDTSRQNLDPGLDDLGSRVQIRYLSDAT